MINTSMFSRKQQNLKTIADAAEEAFNKADVVVNTDPEDVVAEDIQETEVVGEQIEAEEVAEASVEDSETEPLWPENISEKESCLAEYDVPECEVIDSAVEEVAQPEEETVEKVYNSEEEAFEESYIEKEYRECEKWDESTTDRESPLATEARVLRDAADAYLKSAKELANTFIDILCKLIEK